MAERGINTQLSLPDTDVSPRLTHEGLRVDSTASDILLGVLESNPEIKDITLTKYLPGESGFDFDPGYQYPLHIVDDQLGKVALKLFDEWQPPLNDPSSGDTYFTELGLFVPMGVSSKVVLKDSSTAHIPMMDYGCEVNEANEQAIVDNMKGIYPGYLLKSGNSYHYWGLNLLRNQAWLDFLKHCSKSNSAKEDPPADKNYIIESKKNGFTVLRLFAYPPDIPTEPTIIRIIH